MPDPVVSPADTPAVLRAYAEQLPTVLSVPNLRAKLREAADEIAALLAVGERDKAAELGPVPTEAGGPGKEETYWLRRKLQASIRHLRDIEDYYRPTGGVFSESRADRARVLYEQITADFLNGKLSEPPEIVALREAGERDRRQIARLTEVAKAAEVVAELNGEGRSSYGRTVTHVEFQNALYQLETAVVAARAVLAGEEDAA